MSRCSAPVIWSTLVWLMIFLYTWFRHMAFNASVCVIPLFGLFLLLTTLIMLLSKRAPETKSIIWLSSLAIMLDIGAILHTYGYFDISDPPDNTWFNIYIGLVLFVGALVWCRVGHAHQISETGWHWYVWSVTTLFAAGSAFDSETDNAIVANIAVCVCLLLAHIIYIWHVTRNQTPNLNRCRHIFRLVAGLVVVLGILIANVVLKFKAITHNVWMELILVCEAVVIVMIWVDTAIGFSQSAIYDPQPMVDYDAVDV